MQFKLWLEADQVMSDVQKLYSVNPNRVGVKDFPFPFKKFDTEYVSEKLARHDMGNKKGVVQFTGQVQWGEGSGAVRLRLMTKGDVMIERLHDDLQGNKVWITKRFYAFARDQFTGKEDFVVEEMLDAVREVNKSEFDAPLKEFKDLETLVRKIIRKSSNNVGVPLFYESAKKVNDNNYIIVFGLRGAGTEAPDHRRVEQVIINLCHHPDTGILQLFSTNIESSMSQHEWQQMPSDYEAFHLPSQPEDEIIDAVTSNMKFY